MEAYLVGAVRTPVGRRGGLLSGVHPADMGAAVISEVLRGVDPGAVDDVILGCVDTLGPQSGDIARTAWLAAGFPEHVPGVTVDRQCGSSQQAVHFAAQAVMSGTADLVVAGGVQSMSMIPIGSAMAPGGPYAGSAGWASRYGDQEVSQFRSADDIAARWSISREAMEAYALTSHEKSVKALDGGLFAREILGGGPGGVRDAGGGGRGAGWWGGVDECPRRDTSAERIAALEPLREGGVTTAAMAGQIADGAAALLVASERAVRDHGLRPRARIHHLSARGDDPVLMLTAPIPATAHALRRTGLSIDDIDRFEVNEAFASVALAWLKETGADPGRVNVNGGAIALGHPLGATGARLMVSLLHELERCGGRYGLQTMCEGGGQANVTIIERL
ncbi:acetyl-CoA acetyltransferase [Actinoplanes philippinensis]|uniref:Acetyl-CoA C-acetyltransferase n=1 Tax=Actinoplanes philippinensis TaxID=35752 RepID=A0A1I2A070_9ACTN|nr:acetyl-CoA C-acetyltransferase [Actinoplanes philippinensis]GIE75194.1 acetyl-CoA acetyltransferase [Actinoplanes philippinensis]SFE37018.1 acetyl-CoA C-acetyltransferase [Actinoplanes philippinensis]